MTRSFWLLIVTNPKTGGQVQVTYHPDNRKVGRELAQRYRDAGWSAHVVKRHEWEPT